MRRLPPDRPLSATWLIPAFAAAIWSGLMTLVADEPAATQRSLVFLGGPLVLLSGLHARLFAFLHAPARMRWLPLPIGAARHWQAAVRSHHPPFLVAATLGAAALMLAIPGRPSARGISSDTALVLEFCWFAALAGLLEPVASASAAIFGRRFPETSRAHELQRSLGGGWTTPEAVVHLYAPAFAVGLAVLLAMPGQLSLERWVDGHAVSSTQLGLGLTPALIAIALRLAAPALYRRGVWEAVPRLAEATRTLAGPPQPEPSPAWARAISDPWLRLVVIQFWRITALPYLRLGLVVGLAVHTATRADPPSGYSVAVAVAAIGAWVVPAGTLIRERAARARLAGALPLSRLKRRGYAGIAAGVALAAPPVALLGSIALRALG
ncbi:hypothetical protein ENSA5_42520 [Enhygromyxa salina]|uniref:Uncharacterized protein n=1 Tax=Enhygromyxa salina TaxID=215803 RepID=A0A2S9XLT9_9BACT|nr:hypothetical protein [Enhygromyxa salina]PRP93848.1 hypothetical protein ENSA5_42520 [Enhygromyxa salina]